MCVPSLLNGEDETRSPRDSCLTTKDVAKSTCRNWGKRSSSSVHVDFRLCATSARVID